LRRVLCLSLCAFERSKLRESPLCSRGTRARTYRATSYFRSKRRVYVGRRFRSVPVVYCSYTASWLKVVVRSHSSGRPWPQVTALHNAVAVRVPLPGRINPAPRQPKQATMPECGNNAALSESDLSVERYTSRLERWPNRDRVEGEAWRCSSFNGLPRTQRYH
jgi:hypothetical protein